MDMDKDMVMVMKEIYDTMELMVVIIQILRKAKPHGTIGSGIIVR